VSEIAHSLNSLDQNEPRSANQLLPLVYDELRKLAAARMANESPGNTLQPTALVHEAWLRLGGDKDTQYQNRAHFFAAAAEAMRRILIEKARRKVRLRHGGGQERVDLDAIDAIAPSEQDNQLLAVSDALDHLAQRCKVEADLVKLRYFVGMTLEEAAQALGISARTADTYWAHAKAWLFREIKRQSQGTRRAIHP
jgi:RNA polymerase sigma factor (TIGR02999 family)